MTDRPDFQKEARELLVFLERPVPHPSGVVNKLAAMYHAGREDGLAEGRAARDALRDKIARIAKAVEEP